MLPCMDGLLSCYLTLWFMYCQYALFLCMNSCLFGIGYLWYYSNVKSKIQKQSDSFIVLLADVVVICRSTDYNNSTDNRCKSLRILIN